MNTIGLIDPDRLQNIPEKHWAEHEFCFHLHDLMAALLVQMEIQKAGHIRFETGSEDDRRLLASGIHILDFLDKSGRGELERRAVVNHVCNALFSDMLHFIYEALRALEKRKFTVAFSLLRKPLKEGMLIVAQMCADEGAFFDRLKADAKNLLSRRNLDEAGIKALLEAAMKLSRGCSFTNPDKVYDAVFNYHNDQGFAGLFDKATHLVTEFRRNQTEDYNLNFIFKNPEDDDIYAGGTYAQLAMLILVLHIMQIELYRRMGKASKKYQNWMLFTSVGAYEALFTKGRSRMTNFVNSNFAEFMQCRLCEAQLRIKKVNAPRLFIGERLYCEQCLADQHFPFGWLLSKVDLDLFED
ncbi:hypothetical protein FQV27_05450 [Paracoccus aurantiacus]|uniref:Uncharacterized protein n=1 Tax=Paracoccus aurantiacus TaxID=2599412 RepID=A0A5C6SCF9_9RHOB|nr:hypothetical protein FQV27_05450 [Paracoccus aurantiacus]